MNKPWSKIADVKAEKIADRVLVNQTGRTLEQHIALAREADTIDTLNQYRSALSLWAEHTNDTKQKVIITLDGRDTAWKWSNIKRVTEYFNWKRYKTNAYWIPEIDEKIDYNWFKRYVEDFPRKWQVAFFDRSWYNRAWVEAAMWFCTQEEYDWFLQNVLNFENEQILDQWINFLKIYLSVTKTTQKHRLYLREDVRKSWKSSPIDKVAQEKWNYYTLAKAKMLELTDSETSPWIVLDSNEKWLSAIEIIKALINTTSEVSKIVEKDLSIDLKPNKSIRRTAKEELARMKKNWDLKAMKQEFHFRVPTDEEVEYVENFRRNNVFYESTYSYIPVE